MAETTHIVKRKGHKEAFDERKAYASVFWACASAHGSRAECEQIAEKVVKALNAHLKRKKEIESAEIFEFLGNELQKHHSGAAYMFRTHRDLS